MVTIIIPSLTRPTLFRALNSLHQQTDPDWNCIVMLDGCLKHPKLLLENEKIKIYNTTRKGNAGQTRNEAFPYVDRRWTGFLDDDDELKETYVEKVKYYEEQYPELDIIIFSFKHHKRIVPPPNVKQISFGNVGISFVIKTEFIKKHKLSFGSSIGEDYHFLKECQKHEAKYKITHDIQYYVKDSSKPKLLVKFL